jgi:hypothetical protein
MDYHVNNRGGAYIREDLAEIMKRDSIRLGAVARQCRVPHKILVAWLDRSAKMDVEYAVRVREFISDRITIDHINREVNNELRGNAVTEYFNKIYILANLLHDPEEPDRDAIFDEIDLHVRDAKRVVALMALEQTVRGVIEPGDRLMVIKSGGKKAVGE